MPQASATLSDIYALMIGASDITNAVGTKIYPGAAPQDTALPFITYELVASEPNYCVDGGPGSGDTDTVQVSVFGVSGVEVGAIAADVVDAIEEQLSSVYTQEFLLEDDTSGVSISSNNADDRIHWRFLTFSGITR